jgi:hypothetical protein
MIVDIGGCQAVLVKYQIFLFNECVDKVVFCHWCFVYVYLCHFIQLLQSVWLNIC